MKKNLLVIIGVLLCAYSYSQDQIDAFRFSGDDLAGTARGQAMGGAFGALGGDITGVTINPGGIGVYRSSELTATFGLNSVNTKNNWQGSINKEDKSYLNMNNISYVCYYPIGNENLKSLNFGFTFNRLKNFNRNYSASGKGMKTSLTDYMEAITDGIHSDYLPAGKNEEENYGNGSPWLSILGWNGYLIDLDNHSPNDNTRYTSILNSGESVSPHLGVSERGHIDNYDFTVGTNFSNTFYGGITFSITDICYTMDASYGEEFGDGGSFILDNYLETKGSGYQVRLGAIWRPTDFLRLGIAYHSPSWYVMRNYYKASIYPDIEFDYGKKNTPVSTPESAYTDYRYQTPYSWVFSAAGIIGTHAIVSVDYEVKDYQSMNLKDQYAYNYVDINNDMNDNSKMASTLRAGFEYRFTSQFSGRLGYSWMQNPYEKTFKDNQKEVIAVGTIPHYVIEGDVNYLTAGIGYRFSPDFYLDFALVQRSQKNDLYFFPFMNSKRHGFEDQYPVAASFKNISYKGLVTLGFKF